jgi:hypothetical protein
MKSKRLHIPRIPKLDAGLIRYQNKEAEVTWLGNFQALISPPVPVVQGYYPL